MYAKLIESYPTAPEIADARHGHLLTTRQLDDGEAFVAEAEQFAQTFQNAQNPHVPAVMYQLGEYFLSKEDYDRAIAAFQRFLAAYPGQELAAAALYGIGWCAVKQNNAPQAIKEFEKLLAQFPNSPYAADALYAIATSQFKEKNYAEAAARYATLLQKYPAYAMNERAYLNRGVALLQTGDAAAAILTLQESLRRFPKQANLHETNLTLGYAFARQRDCQKAMPFFGQVAASKNAALAAEAQFRLGECYADMRERDKAIVDYLKVVYLFPNQAYWVANAQYKAALLYEELGKEEDALTLYQKIVDSAQDAALVEKARQRLAALKQELPDTPE